MMDKIRNAVLAASLAAGFFQAAYSQEIDPTVEVSRAYRGKMMEVHKPFLGMQIPDSVTRFDLDFDYSVFDNPYKGSYEFNPYVRDMKPDPAQWGGRRLYLRAGAGYPLSPVFDFVWSPDLKRRFKMSVYASNRSYFGKYRSIEKSYLGDNGRVVLDSRSRSSFGRSSSELWNGYDSETSAGISGRTDWEKGTFSFDVGYHGIAAKDTVMSRSYNALDTRFRVRSTDCSDRHFVYDIVLGYRYGHEDISPARHAFGTHEALLDATLGMDFTGRRSLLVDIDFMYEDVWSYNWGAGQIDLNPRYVFGTGRWDFDLGARFSAFLPSSVAGVAPTPNRARSQFIYPDISLSYGVLRERMDIYMEIGGGNDMNRYSEMISRNHRFSIESISYGTSVSENTVERVSADIGLRGNIGARLMYDVSAGYSNYASARFDAVLDCGPLGMRSTYSYAPVQVFHADADFSWKSEDIDFNGALRYCSTDISSGSGFLFSPAAFSGRMDFTYNWRRRVFAGIDCEFATIRNGAVAAHDGIAFLSITDSAVPRLLPASIPAYADLGIYLEFRTARMFSFWLRGGNLLDMTIQRTPLYAESGINFTAGICLNL